MPEQQHPEPRQPPPDPPAIPASRLVDAVYVDGVIRPVEPLDLPPGTPIRLLIPSGVTVVALPVTAPTINGAAAPAVAAPPAMATAQAEAPPAAAAPPAQGALPALQALARPLAGGGLLGALTWGDALLILAGLAFYAATRLIDLTRFPIYFFCDEAIQTVLARDLLANGLRGPGGVLLPPYFPNAEKWSLSLSVYIQLIGVALFGTSVFVTRATTVAVSLLTVVAMALTLKLIFQNRFWWAAGLALAAVPTWFLHARTAFETVMMVAFYAGFLCCYLLYRYRSPGWLFPALLFGGMTFYSYTNGQGVMLVSGLLLLLSDLRHHLSQGLRRLTVAAGTLALLAVPMVRFRLLEPDAVQNHLRVLDSYWLKPLPLSEKLGMFAQNYLLGLSPGYWFLPNQIDLERHRMLGMGHLPLLFLPFVLIGLAICVQQWRSAAHRALIVATLAAPFSMSLVGIGVTRTLAMVVPATMLALIGLAALYSWVQRRLPYRLAAGIVAITLVASSLTMLRSALVDGPTWYTNYGLGGMQYGAEQLFGQAIPAELARQPEAQLLVSPTWANNPNSFVDFFLSDAQRARVQLVNVDAFLVARRDLDPARQIFVMPADEYQRAQESGKFIIAEPERIIPYPDGQPGFYFVRMSYVPNVDALFAADRVARSQLVETLIDLDGASVGVGHSLLDIGTIENLFDGDTNSLVRGFEANPLVVELRFAGPRPLSGLTLTTGSMDIDLTVRVTPPDGGPDLVFSQVYTGLPNDPTVEFTMPDGPIEAGRLRIEIRHMGEGEVAHVHVRELTLR